MSQRYVVFMLNRRVSFHQMETEVQTVMDGPVTYVNPGKKELGDLTKFLKSNPLVREVEIYSDNVELTWMTYCMHYFEVVSAGGMSRGRTLMQRLNSPGWVQSWAEVHYDWFEGATPELNSYVFKGDVDSIAHYLACSEEEAHLAMWWWDLNAPTHMTSGWWARYNNTPIGMLRSNSLANEDLFTSENFLDQRWTTPSNDIVYTEELYGTWTAILVLKYESMACLREWGAFRGISETLGVKRNDIRFLILCIDGNEESWKKVLRNRTSTDEMVRWIGTDARWMNGLDINSVPQVVVVTPGLDIYNFTAPLPSLGLRRYLELLPR